MTNETLAVKTEPDLAEIDRHFARFIGRFGGDRYVVEPVAALLSRSIRNGHICLDPEDLSEMSAVLELSPLEEVPARLKKSPAFGEPEANTPIVIDRASRLYLRRYWAYEQDLADAILRKARHNQATIDVVGT